MHLILPNFVVTDYIDNNDMLSIQTRFKNTKIINYTWSKYIEVAWIQFNVIPFSYYILDIQISNFS